MVWLSCTRLQCVRRIFLPVLTFPHQKGNKTIFNRTLFLVTMLLCTFVEIFRYVQTTYKENAYEGGTDIEGSGGCVNESYKENNDKREPVDGVWK